MEAHDRTADNGQSMPPNLLTAREAAVAIGVHERTIRRAIARGELSAIKRAGVFRIDRADLARYRATVAIVPQQASTSRASLVILPRVPTAAD